jgi:SAM-dependent methyltransferase
VRDDDRDFYGKGYWLTHQRDGLSLPDIVDRARMDLPERCMHWLRALLRYKQPPARILEIGCAHGGFVALARWAGYDATGLELSPWVADFARHTFDVPMIQGPVEDQSLPEDSFDAIVLNDVLEHLANPVRTVGCCTRLLREDGILFIQTPCYPEGVTFGDLCSRKDRFLETMEGRAAQHLYLFSRRAVQQLLSDAGFSALEFLSPMFEYDMYLVAGRQPLRRLEWEDLARKLTASLEGRMKLAWLEFLMEFEAREADRAARLEQIHQLHELLRQSETARQAESDRRSRFGGNWLGLLRRLYRRGLQRAA